MFSSAITATSSRRSRKLSNQQIREPGEGVVRLRFASATWLHGREASIGLFQHGDVKVVCLPK